MVHLGLSDFKKLYKYVFCILSRDKGWTELYCLWTSWFQKKMQHVKLSKKKSYINCQVLFDFKMICLMLCLTGEK